jgi:hypothetical protein
MNEIAFAVILVLVFFFSPLLVSLKALKRTKKISLLEQEVFLLKKEMKALRENNPSSEKIQADQKKEPVVLKEVIKETQPHTAPAPVEPSVLKPLIPSVRKRFQFRWRWNQERIFAFLGALLGIIGLVFLTLYLGNRIGILFRFLIMTGFSLILLLISFPLGRKEKWDELAHISRSLSGALFLFAVFASSTIEGLKWIDSPLLALGVISIGTIYNLLLGYFCRKKGYAVFHMTINYLVIFLLPPESLVFWLAFVLTVGLQIGGYFRKEEISTALSFLFFGFYCLFFKETAVDFSFFSWCFNLTALISYISFIVHKEFNYKLQTIFNYALPIFWIGFAVGLADSKMAAVIPLVAGTIIGAFLRIRMTKDIKSLLFWPLQILVSGVFLILASGSGTQYWLTLLYLESCLFAYGMIREKENQVIPLLLNYVILISSVAYGFFSESLIINFQTAINRLILMVAASYFLNLAAKDNEKNNKDFVSLTNIFQFLLAVFAFFLSFKMTNSVSVSEILLYSGLIFIILFIAAENILKIRIYGIWFASIFPLLRVVSFYLDNDVFFKDSLFLILPLLLLIMVGVIYGRMRKVEHFPDWGVFLFSLILMVTFIFPFWQISTVLPGILILLASFLYYILWEKKAIWEIQVSGLLFLVVFFIRHITHHLQMEQYWSIINVRFLIEITAMIVFSLYLKSSRWKETDRIPILNKTLQGTAFTLSWLFLLLMMFSHSNRNMLSLVFQFSIVLLLFLEKRKYLTAYPLTMVAYIHFIFAQVNLALNTHPSFPFLPGILQNPWIFGLVNLGASIIVIYLFFRHFLQGSFAVSPVFLKMRKLTELIMEHKNLTLLIPLFASLGLFFNWTLEATALTIALFFGCFLLYGTALILKENIFRHTTSLALLGTTVRLIFWDLAQSTMLAKSIAFLGASIIFILINILYSQFKGRFNHV